MQKWQIPRLAGSPANWYLPYTLTIQPLRHEKPRTELLWHH